MLGWLWKDSGMHLCPHVLCNLLGHLGLSLVCCKDGRLVSLVDRSLLETGLLILMVIALALHPEKLKFEAPDPLKHKDSIALCFLAESSSHMYGSTNMEQRVFEGNTQVSFHHSITSTNMEAVMTN